MMMIVMMMMIALYTNDDDLHHDDDRIVHTLAIYNAIFFGNGRRNKAILGVGWGRDTELQNVCAKILES